MGESIDAYANNIWRLAMWMEFIGRSAEKIVKLAFVHGFLGQISIALQQLLQVETKKMSKLIMAARVLSVNRTEESRSCSTKSD